MTMKLSKFTLLITSLLSSYSVLAEEGAQDSDVQDMSDPLSVYTQAGIGFTDKGVNVKIGQTYDTGSETTAGMNVIEIKGIMGDVLGWSGSSRRDDSIDSFRWRNFQADLSTGRGSQLDISYSIGMSNPDVLNASYSFLQALPKFGPVQIFPLGGVGVMISENNSSYLAGAGSNGGYDILGTYGLIGFYGKLAITDKIWLNYNPFYISNFSGTREFKDADGVLTHEFSASYQVTPRANIRYFANWGDALNPITGTVGEVKFDKGDHRIEFNYQL